MAEKIPFRGEIKDKIRAADLNMFATLFYFKNAPLIADDYARACIGTDFRWDVLAIYHWIVTDFGNSTLRKSPWPGIEGSHEDLAINGVLFLKRDGTQYQYADDVPQTEPEQLARMRIVLARWERHSEALRAQRSETPTPIPVPPPEAPPQPVEPPKPQEPQEPYGWWDCPKCGADNNPPKLQRCMKCRAPRPGSVPEVPKPPQEPKPEAPKPDEPKPPQTGRAWKKKALAAAAVLSGSAIILKLFLPGWGDIALDAIIALLKAIGSM